MKTAISIPDKVFVEAERMAKHLKISRSRLYASAVEKYVQAHRSKGVTEALNEVYAKEASSLDKSLSRLQSASLPREKW